MRNEEIFNKYAKAFYDSNGAKTMVLTTITYDKAMQQARKDALREYKEGLKAKVDIEHKASEVALESFPNEDMDYETAKLAFIDGANWMNEFNSTSQKQGYSEEDIIVKLNDKYNNAYKNTKEGHQYPTWFNKEQLDWIKELLSTLPKSKSERTNQSNNTPRYFVDIRGGCGAVRDKWHKSYDEDYPGLHSDTPDVVEYKHGFIANGIWNMTDEDVKYLNNLCERLNNKINTDDLTK